MLINRQMDKHMCYIQTVEYYSYLKGKEILTHATTWMYLEDKWSKLVTKQQILCDSTNTRCVNSQVHCLPPSIWHSIRQSSSPLALHSHMNKEFLWSSAMSSVSSETTLEFLALLIAIYVLPHLCHGCLSFSSPFRHALTGEPLI